MPLSQDTITRLEKFKASDRYGNLSDTTKSRLDTYLNKSSQQGEIIPKESAGRTFYREAISPLLSGVSTFALGIPKTTAEVTGAKEIMYPEQKTIGGKILRGGAETAGFLLGTPIKAGQLAVRGATKLIPPLAGKGVLKTATRLGIEGAAIGGALTPEKTLFGPKERLEQAKTFGTVGAVIPLGGKLIKGASGIVTKSGRWIAKNVGGITDATVNTIKQLGAERVFDPLKAKADYIAQDLAPRIFNKLSTFVTEADSAYKNAVKSFKGNTINSQPFYQTIQRGLRLKGWVDLQGNPTTDYKSGLDPIVDKLTTLYLRMRPTVTTQGKRIAGQVISKEDFFTYRDALSSMLREKPSDRLVMQARNSLYDSAEKSGMQGIKVARDLEKKVFEMEDKLDIKKISSDLIKARNPNWTKYVKSEYDKILGEKGFKDVYDDLMAHFANVDFELVNETPGAGGGFYPSRAGLLRSGVAKGAKVYYKGIQPKLKVLQELGGKVTSPIMSRVNPQTVPFKTVKP